MEAASKKRGRPRVVPDGFRLQMRRGGDLTSDRSHRNYWWFAKAHVVFKEFPEFSWLLEKPGLMMEVGRFPSGDTMYDAAEWCCSNKPKTKEGITYLRRWRLALAGKKETTGTPTRLQDELLRALDNFLMRYPRTSWETMREAITGMLEIVELAEARANAEEEKVDRETAAARAAI